MFLLGGTTHLIAAQKLCSTPSYFSAGRMTMNDQFNAKISGLFCSREGVLGMLACGLIRRRLAQLENETVRLSAFANDVRFEDLSLELGDAIRVKVNFRCG
jgi:hypothetical protein